MRPGGRGRSVPEQLVGAQDDIDGSGNVSDCHGRYVCSCEEMLMRRWAMWMCVVESLKMRACRWKKEAAVPEQRIIEYLERNAAKGRL